MRFHHVALNVKNIIDSTNFYCEVFDFVKIRELYKGSVLVGVHLQQSNFILELLSGDVFEGSIHLAMFVDSTSEFYNLYKQMLNFEREPFKVGDETIVFLYDPNGYRIEINDRL